VEALRDRGVEAYGIDISNYAIGEVRRDIRPYCRVASATDPLLIDYDLIVCIEVLEHLSEADGRLAISRLCKCTKDILFSSTPDDFTEPTHINVRPRAYWDALFAEQGFDFDTEFDARCIAPHAMRFRKRATRLYTLDALLDQRTRLQEEFRCSEEESRLSNDDLRRRLAEIEQSVGWRAVVRLKRLREKLAPPQSVRLKWYSAFRELITEIMSNGVQSVLRSAWRELTHRATKEVQPTPMPAFRESVLAHSLLDGLKGLEIGAAGHNPFGLNTRNVELPATHQFYADEVRRLSGTEPPPVHIWASADSIPVPDQSEGFVVTSHIVEHLPNIIAAFLEWDRIIIDGGYVFMIVPHQWAFPADQGRELTPLAHFISDYTQNVTIDTHPVDGVPGGQRGHYHTFSPESVLQLVEWMCRNTDCDWELVAREDIDSKVGNGFTLAFLVRHPSRRRSSRPSRPPKIKEEVS
jgi:hypothetical protein